MCPACVTSLLLFCGVILPLAIRFHQPLRAVKLLNNLSLRGEELKGKRVSKLMEMMAVIGRRVLHSNLTTIQEKASVSGEIGLYLSIELLLCEICCL